MIKNSSPILHIAIPILREFKQIALLLQSIESQKFKGYCVYFCINQPDHWWDDPDHIEDCLDNEKTFDYIQQNALFPFVVVDKFSKGKGWSRNKSGVGWARKILFNTILEKANNNDIVLSLDADTTFEPNYFQSIVDSFITNPNKVALSVPYYHKLTDDHKLNRKILRYEIYLRTYLINLILINSPYAFTAIGSAMAIPVWAYKKSGGMKPYQSGEDFYLMQKLSKMGELNLCHEQTVYPSSRYSDRVPFGTGPTMISTSNGNWDKYPIFPNLSFQMIREFYDIAPKLFYKDLETSLDSFFEYQFKDKNIWVGIRENSKTVEQFMKKVHQKFDGLRILQFLRYQNKKQKSTDIDNLKSLLFQFSDFSIQDYEAFSFEESSIETINNLRNSLFLIEEKLRCQKKN